MVRGESQTSKKGRRSFKAKSDAPSTQRIVRAFSAELCPVSVSEEAMQVHRIEYKWALSPHRNVFFLSSARGAFVNSCSLYTRYVGISSVPTHDRTGLSTVYWKRVKKECFPIFLPCLLMPMPLSSPARPNNRPTAPPCWPRTRLSRLRGSGRSGTLGQS